MDMSSDTNRWIEIVTSLMTTNFTETNEPLTVPDDEELANMVSDVNNTSSLFQHQQSASDANFTYPVEQSSIQHNIENGLSAANLEHNQHHQTNPYFNHTVNQWYSNSNDVFHSTSYSSTDPIHHQSGSSASFDRSSGNFSEPIGNTWGMENYSSADDIIHPTCNTDSTAYPFHPQSDSSASFRSSGNISEPILNTWDMENYGSTYSVYNQHLEPFNGAVYETQNYYSEAAYSNNFPLHPEQSVIQPTNVQRDVQIGNQQQMNRQFNYVNEYQMVSALTEFSATLNPSGNCYNRTQWRPKVHICEVCSTGFTTAYSLTTHFNTYKHKDGLRKKKFPFRFASEA